MSLDLGGIAKGYALDVCYDRLSAMGARNFMLNLGGNIRVRGTPRKDETWVIGVRNPFQTGEIVGAIRLASGMAVGTSGNYERFVTIAGKKYGHIMDPRSGRPAEGMAGVTIVATNGVQSDGLSKPLFILGPEGSKDFRNRFRAWRHCSFRISRRPSSGSRPASRRSSPPSRSGREGWRLSALEDERAPAAVMPSMVLPRRAGRSRASIVWPSRGPHWLLPGKGRSPFS